MQGDLAALSKRLREVPPRCISLAQTSPAHYSSDTAVDENDLFATCWAIGVYSSHDHCAVLGKSRNITSSPPTTVLQGAIGLLSGDKLIEIFDPSVHGYNNEIDAIDCGIEKLPIPAAVLASRHSFYCDKCRRTNFLVNVSTYFQPGTLDILMSDESLPASDMFNSFNITGICQYCMFINIISEADGL
jgi:hypothetical protein